jgi:phosphatidylinositol alpha-1,6-mannosyltransferase
MILFVTQTFLPETGGIPALMTGLVQALTVHGHPAEVYCRASRLHAVKAFDASRRYPVHRFGGAKFWRRWQMGKAVTRRIRQGGVTTLIVDNWKILADLPGGALKSVQVICLAHGNEYAGRSVDKHGIIRSLARANGVVANSEFTAGLVRPFAGKTPVTVVLPGITPPPGARAGDVSQAFSQRLLCMTRLEARKGLDQLIGAVAALKSVYPRISLDIVGHGEDLGRLTELASSLGMKNRVQFHGTVSDTARTELIRQARAFVMPNRNGEGVDGFPMAFLEAAALGVPGIAGRAGGAGDAVLDGETGLIIDGEDIDALTDALRRLLNDDGLHRRLGEAAQARFWSDFAWSEAVARYEAAFGLTGDKT